MRCSRFIPLLVLCLVPVTALADDLGEELRAAAVKGDLVALQSALKNGADINATDELGRSALLLAVEKGQKETVRFLVEQGANVNLGNRTNGIRPMHYAMWFENMDLVSLLLGAGAEDANMVLNTGAFAGAPALVDAALKTDKIRPRDLTCALSLAEERGHGEIVKKLREAGAKPPAKLGSAKLQTYAGVYEAPDGSELTFFAEHDKLVYEGVWELQELVSLDEKTMILPANLQHEAYREEIFRFQFEGNKVAGVVHVSQGKEKFFPRTEEE